MHEVELNAYLAAIVESSDDAIISKDLNGIIRSFNPAAERMFGYSADEIVGRSITLLIPPDRIGEEKEILRRLRLGERIDHFETIRRTKDGRLLDISLTVSPVRDTSGQVVGASKIARDITAQKRAAAVMAQYAAIIESTDDAIISKGLDQIIHSFNPAAERMFGYAAPRSSAGRSRLLIPPDRLSEEAEILARLRRGERLDHYETVRVAKDGRRLDISLTVSHLRNTSGEIIGAAKVARDITEKKRGANALASSRSGSGSP
jgi:PAS domain S-box-containing protein